MKGASLDRPAKAILSPRRKSVRRGNRFIAVSVATALLSISAVSAVAFGALKSPASPSTVNARGGATVRWVVPHDQFGAPTVPIPGGASGTSGGLNSVSCPTSTFCVAVGADSDSNGVASTSKNGGTSWSQVALASGEPDLNAVDCESASQCVAVGTGAIVRTTNGGKKWTSYAVPTSDTTLLGVNCPNLTTCVSVGVSPSEVGPYAGEVLDSTDGGSTWTAASFPQSAGAMGDVDCPTSTFCVSVGASILVSNDGGKDWSARSVSGGTGVLRTVSCRSATTCVAIGPNPAGAQDSTAAAYEVITTNGGVSWNSMTMPAGTASLDTLSCSTGSLCEAAGSPLKGDSAPIYLSENGGTSWSVDGGAPSSVNNVSSVNCTSTAGCVLVGDSGQGPVAITSNSGGVFSNHPVGSLVRSAKDVS